LLRISATFGHGVVAADQGLAGKDSPIQNRCRHTAGPVASRIGPAADQRAHVAEEIDVRACHRSARCVLHLHDKLLGRLDDDLHRRRLPLLDHREAKAAIRRADEQGGVEPVCFRRTKRKSKGPMGGGGHGPAVVMARRRHHRPGDRLASLIRHLTDDGSPLRGERGHGIRFHCSGLLCPLGRLLSSRRQGQGSRLRHGGDEGHEHQEQFHGFPEVKAEQRWWRRPRQQSSIIEATPPEVKKEPIQPGVDSPISLSHGRSLITPVCPGW
jgi:hypothetical protein